MTHPDAQGDPDINAILAQHAMTTKLFGVDFIPLSEGISQDVSTESDERESESQIEVKPLKGSAPISEPVSTDPATTESVRASYAQVSGKGAQLDALRAQYEHDAPHDAFETDHTSIVFGEGDPDADLMFIGEAPGQEEDASGRPFVGRAGQLLEKMIIAMGFTRESVYICNVLKTRPPNNATPTQDESLASAPYLFEQIRIVDPKVIVTLGRPASCLLLETEDTMKSVRGRFHDFPVPGGRVLGATDLSARTVMPTYHPAYLLRSYTEENRRKVWSDLQQVVAALKGS